MHVETVEVVINETEVASATSTVSVLDLILHRARQKGIVELASCSPGLRFEESKCIVFFVTGYAQGER